MKDIRTRRAFSRAAGRRDSLLLAAALLLSLAACGGERQTLPLVAATPGPAVPAAAMETAAPATASGTPAPPVETPAAAETPVPAETDPPAPEELPEPEERTVDIRGAKPVTLLQPVTAYNSRKDETRTLPAGTELMVAAETDGEWMEASLGRENIWLRLDEAGGFRVETPDGWLFEWVVMDGLSFAD